jgi:hypothetical protein
MSELVFNGATHQISLIDRNGNTVGSWQANNVVERAGSHLRFVPNGTHILVDHSAPHRHAGSDRRGIPLDSERGSYGSHGIVRLAPTHGHAGIGVHSGRAGVADGMGRMGPNHATQGCIRTTDDAMRVIAQTMHTDALRTITVRNNRDQQ